MPFPKGKSGNPQGKKVGVKARKTLEWEALGESIAGQNAANFNSFLLTLWDSPQIKDKVMASELFLNALEYFKPKLGRSNIDVTSGGEPIRTPNIIIPRPESEP